MIDMIKNFIWDFDGMLFDSYPHIASAFMKMAEDYGVEAKYEEVMASLRVSFGEAYEKYNINEEMKTVFREYENDGNLPPVIVPYPDTYEVLHTIFQDGGRNFLFTHRGESAKEYLKKYKMNDFFVECVTKSNGFKSKPSPNAINYLVDKYNLIKAETIMVGDREIDVLSGKNAGIKTCLFDEFIEGHKTVADFVVTNIKMLLEIK